MTSLTPPAADPPDARDVVFYDGHCGLCHRSVLFLLKRDDGSRFVFAPLQGETIAARLGEAARAALPDSVVVLQPDGRVFVKSSATVALLRRLGGGWRWLGHGLWLVPRPVRHLGYDAVAATRHRLFKRPADACPLVPEEMRARFLP